MIHSSSTIDRIRELLMISGIPEGEVLEELVDHYLTEIENTSNTTNNIQEAIRTTFQHIAQADFGHFKKKNRSKMLLIGASLVFLLLSFGWYQNNYVSQITDQIMATEEDTAPNGWPLNDSSMPITSKFGMRIHPISKKHRLHRGIDIKAKNGTPVLATGSGIVKETGFSDLSGWYIIIKHNNRFSTRYNHLASINVLKNDKVREGHPIGKVGTSGMSLAPHLHYEILDGKECIDPLDYAIP